MGRTYLSHEIALLSMAGDFVFGIWLYLCCKAHIPLVPFVLVVLLISLYFTFTFVKNIPELELSVQQLTGLDGSKIEIRNLSTGEVKLLLLSRSNYGLRELINFSILPRLAVFDLLNADRKKTFLILRDLIYIATMLSLSKEEGCMVLPVLLAVLLIKLLCVESEAKRLSSFLDNIRMHLQMDFAEFYFDKELENFIDQTKDSSYLINSIFRRVVFMKS